MRKNSVGSILVKIGVTYFIIMGAILFLVQFGLPLLLPSTENFVLRINDILVFIITPFLVMIILNRELNDQTPTSVEKLKIVATINQEIDSMSLNYSTEAFRHKKERLKHKVKQLAEME